MLASGVGQWLCSTGPRCARRWSLVASRWLQAHPFSFPAVFQPSATAFDATCNRADNRPATSLVLQKRLSNNPKLVTSVTSLFGKKFQRIICSRSICLLTSCWEPSCDATFLRFAKRKDDHENGFSAMDIIISQATCGSPRGVSFSDPSKDKTFVGPVQLRPILGVHFLLDDESQFDLGQLVHIFVLCCVVVC